EASPRALRGHAAREAPARRLPAAPLPPTPRRVRHPPALSRVSLRAPRAPERLVSRRLDARGAAARHLRRGGAGGSGRGARLSPGTRGAGWRDRRPTASAPRRASRARHRRAVRGPRRYHREPARRTRSRERPHGHPANADPRHDRRAVPGGRVKSRTLCALALAALVGCAPKHGPAPRDLDRASGARDDARIAELYKTRTAGADYCLGPGDQLTVNVFGWDAMKDLPTRVSPTGSITLPMLGDIPAGGQTETQVQAEIERRLRNGYMRDPHVTVFVQRFQSQQVSVTGAVARPGLYSLTRDNRTVYDLLSQAGGLTEQAGGRVLFSPADGARCGAHAPAP